MRTIIFTVRFFSDLNRLSVKSISSRSDTKKPSFTDLDGHGRIILGEYIKSFNIMKGQEFSTLRIYSRILKQASITRKDSFITFKPRFTHIDWNQSLIFSQLVKMDYGQMGYGLALYNGIHKLWIAPYGNQLEFMQALRTNYVPFIDLPGNPGIPHFIGFFPHLQYHQVYYYLGKDKRHVDPRLADLNPDYFGFSRTYDCEWNVIKENTYAIRVPFSNYANKGCYELPSVQYLNVSYRRLVDVDEESISYLCYKKI